MLRTFWRGEGINFLFLSARYMCERSQALSISVPGKCQVGRKYRIIIISFYQISEKRKV
jgi:hypothetical protein